MAITRLLQKVLDYNDIDLLDLANNLTYDPFLMKGMRETVDYLTSDEAKINKIMIVGDYDVDGAVSTKLCIDICSSLGLEYTFYLPNRKTDGYGLNVEIINNAYKSGCKTILTCDNGIKAIDAIARAKELGMFVIVTDHHLSSFEDELPNADIIVNPNQTGCEYPFKHLCGAGVVYKIMEALNIVKPDTYELVALATVCDSMEILDENRYLVIEGLKSFRYPKNLGLCMLCNKLELLNKNITTYHLGFLIGPHINASGRLVDASISEKLLLSADTNECKAIIEELVSLNKERQSLTDEGVLKAMKKCKEEDLINVIYLDNVEEGIIGIIAQRIVEYTYKPTLIFTNGANQTSEDVTIFKGSGRSVKGYNMSEELDNVSYLIEKFGGHEGAAGLSVRADMLTALKECLNEVARQSGYEFKREVKYIDIEASDVTVENIKSLKMLEPFGKGNSRPTFRVKNMIIQKLTRCGSERDVLQFNMTTATGIKLRGVGFRVIEPIHKELYKAYSPEQVAMLYAGRPIGCKLNVIGELNINEYKDNEYPQMIIKKVELCD